MMYESQRERVNSHYNTAIHDNKHKFDKKLCPKATSEYIYSNQKTDALNVVRKFLMEDRVIVSVQKRTKVGADGLMLQIVRLMCEHPDDEFIRDIDNVRIITGMSNASWEKDMIDKAPLVLKDKIFHHGKLQKSDIKSLDRGLIIIDEIDTGDNEDQKLDKQFKKSGLLDINILIEKNIKIVVISATMARELYDLYEWGERYHATVMMSTPDLYVSHGHLLDKGIIKEFYPLTKEDSIEKWLREDILDNYQDDYRVHIVRLGRNSNTIKNKCSSLGIVYKNHTSNERIIESKLAEIFSKPLESHIVIAVKGFYRRANLIPNDWKIKIGAVHELHTATVDNNVQIQGLVGRMTGYWKDVLETDHKTGPYRTSIKSIKQYEKFMEDIYGQNDYKCRGFRKKDGNVKDNSSRVRSFLHAEHFKVDGIVKPKEHQVYHYTDLCSDDDKEALNKKLKERLVDGCHISFMKLDENGQFHYRDYLRDMIDYTTKEEFVKEKEIHWGVNHNHARMMPVLKNKSIHWIGIYSYKSIKV